MKSKTRKTALYIVAFFAIAAFNIIAFTSNAGEVDKSQIYVRSAPGETCYQALRYCDDGWRLTYKCLLEETSQLCVRYVCEDCSKN